MNTTTISTSLDSWKSFIKAFLIAVALGLLAGATLSTVAHATPTLSPANTSPAGERPLEASGKERQSIARAGRIRQQAQRIAKLYLQIGIGLEVANSKLQLTQAAQLIDRDLAALVKVARDEKTSASLERVASAWQTMRRDFNAPFAAGSQARVFASADALSQHAGRVAATFEQNVGEAGSSLLDLSLRQSMLVQRLARLYLMAYAGDKSVGLQVDIDQARREFASALNELAGNRSNSETSRRALELAKMQWIFFERAIESVRSPRDSNPQHVALTSEQILELLDEVSSQYAQEHA
jgi:hypothetical protein